MNKNQMDRTTIGRVIRKKRKERGWSLDNVANMTSDLSRSTVSNIERGFSGVKEEKIIEYCNILRIPYDQLPQLIQNDNQQHHSLLEKLTRIEPMIDLIGAREAKKQLKMLSLKSENPLSVVFQYLDARCNYHLGNYAIAANDFNSSLHLLEKYPEMEYTNIRSACYKELGRIAFYYHNNLELALQHTQQGLLSYDKNGERKIIKYALLSCKASYLEKIKNDEETINTLKELYAEQDQWYRSTEVVLNMLEIQANLAAKKAYYDEAMNYAKEGLELARANKRPERALELITTLGNICLLKKNYKEAEDWYLFALQFRNKIKNNYLFVSIYTQLGILYMTLEKWSKAKEHLQKAVEKGGKYQNPIRLHLALIAFGDYYVKTNEPKKAIPYFQKAMEQTESHELGFNDPDLYLKLSHCWKEEDSEKSKEYMDKYMQIRLELKQDT
jgi:tetratricopeptide (TPR) repeat protein